MEEAMIAVHQDHEHELMIFGRMMESFLKRWEPQYQEDRYAFHADLHSLIVQVLRTGNPDVPHG